MLSNAELYSVEKPSRYLGGELTALLKIGKRHLTRWLYFILIFMK